MSGFTSHEHNKGGDLSLAHLDDGLFAQMGCKIQPASHTAHPQAPQAHMGCKAKPASHTTSSSTSSTEPAYLMSHCLE